MDVTHSNVSSAEIASTNARTSRAPRPSRLTVQPLDDPPHLLLDYLVQRFPRLQRERWQRRFEDGLIRDRDGERLGVDAPYRPYQQIRYFRQVAEEPRVPFDEHLIYRDERLVVADKPPFLPTVPGGRFVNECLLYRLIERTGIEDLTPLHRLDRMTSGLVAFATSRRWAGAYGKLFARRQVDRQYLALAVVETPPEQRRWHVEVRLEAGEPWFRQRIASGEPNSSTRIMLHSITDGIGRFELRPDTGKTHQLRLHMQHLGFPILGDPLYPRLISQRDAADDYRRPLRLTATTLAFVDPLTGQAMTFSSARRVDDLESQDG